MPKTTSSPKLFIPGPVHISEKTWEAFRSPMIGHRSKDFQELYARVQPGLQELFSTTQPVYVATGSAWSVMEAAIRNLVSRRVLNCMTGAFSDKWNPVSHKCGREADPLQYDWGTAVKPEDVDKALATGKYDAITLVHNETSTGTMNPLEEIAEVVKKYPDVLFIVDVVSSFTVKATPFDELGVDVMLAGTQKALALPPGAAVFCVSQKAQEKADQVEGRGYYLDFPEFLKNHEKNMTPTTPTISHYYALESKIEDIREEGLEARYTRHRDNAETVRQWAKDRGFELFPEAGYESLSLTCIRNTREIDIPALNTWLRETYNCIIDGGYGKIKGTTFRISSMGDETSEDIRQLLARLDEGLGRI